MPTRENPDDKQPDDLSDFHEKVEADYRKLKELLERFGEMMVSLYFGWANGHTEAYDGALHALWRNYPSLRHSIYELKRMGQDTPVSAVIEALFDLYMELAGMAVRPIDPERDYVTSMSEDIGVLRIINSPVQPIFPKLIKIGQRNAARLKQNGIAWARTQMEQIILRCRPVIRDRVQELMGGRLDDPMDAQVSDSYADRFVERMLTLVGTVAEDARRYTLLHPPPQPKVSAASTSTIAKGSAAPEWEWPEGNDQASATGIAAAGGKEPAQEDQGKGAKKGQPVFDRQALINWGKNDRGEYQEWTTYSYAEAASLLGYESTKSIGRLAVEIGELPTKERPLRKAPKRRVFTKEVLLLMEGKIAKPEPPGDSGKPGQTQRRD